MGEQLLRIADVLSGPILVVCAMVGLFDGVRRLCLGNRRWRTIASVALFGGMLLALSGVELWVASLRTPSILASAPAPDVRPERYANVPSDQREKYSRLYAAFLFTNYGVLANHYDGSGQWRVIVPTQQEISDREALLYLDWTLSQTHTNAVVAGVIALLAALVAAFLGWRSARLQRTETANPAFNADPSPAGLEPASARWWRRRAG